MISYKVLVTVTVIFIISCSGSVEECKKILLDVGFSNSLFMNYCFARQFSDLQQFEKLAKRTDDHKLSEVVVEFFNEFRAKYKRGQDKLKTPRAYCEGISKTFIVQQKPIIKGKNIVLKKGAIEDETVEMCTKQILKTSDEKNNVTLKERDKLLKIQQAKEDEKIHNIEYGENQYKNAIKSYYFLSIKSNDRREMMKKWQKFKIKYFEDQKVTIDSKYKKDFSISDWCKKRQEKIKNSVHLKHNVDTLSVQPDSLSVQLTGAN